MSSMYKLHIKSGSCLTAAPFLTMGYGNLYCKGYFDLFPSTEAKYFVLSFYMYNLKRLRSL